VRKRRNQNVEEEEEEQKIEDNSGAINFNEAPETRDMAIQTERLVVTCNADLEIKETTVGLILKGLCLLSEFVSVLVYFDS
jgi:predicted RNA polymerase sigma factor